MTKGSHEASPVLKAAYWLAKSGIQHAGSNPKLKGGVAAWYDLYRRQHPFLYSEITGYAISAYIFLNRFHPDLLWLEKAEAAADWLIRNAFHLSDGVRTRYYLVKGYETPNYSFHAGRVYAFDTAMAGYSLIQLYRTRPLDVYRDHIEKAWEFLTTKIRAAKHNYYPYYDIARRRCGEDISKWSDQIGTFHAKLALFFIDYYGLSGRREARRAAERLLDGVVAAQNKDGRFVTSKKDGSTHLHPHCYTLEGLLYGGAALGEKRYIKAAQKGFDWARQAVSDDGSVSSVWEESGFAFHERSDIVAQMLRAGSILYGMRVDRSPAMEKLLDRIRKHLLLFQFAEKGPQEGGFLYGADTDGRLRIHLNSWASMFAMQALWMHEEFVTKRRPVSLESFV